jgi:hypothetical protein
MGECLLARRALNPEQLNELLDTQRSQRRKRPLGELAQRVYDVDPKQIEAAWADHYVSMGMEVDVEAEPVDRGLLRRITARQAHQFQMLPLRIEAGHVVLATTAERLARAVTFAHRRFTDPPLALIAEPEALNRRLHELYPFGRYPQPRLRLVR